jgi:hypothetical protein
VEVTERAPAAIPARRVETGKERMRLRSMGQLPVTSSDVRTGVVVERDDWRELRASLLSHVRRGTAQRPPALAATAPVRMSIVRRRRRNDGGRAVACSVPRTRRSRNTPPDKSCTRICSCERRSSYACSGGYPRQTPTPRGRPRASENCVARSIVGRASIRERATVLRVKWRAALAATVCGRAGRREGW